MINPYGVAGFELSGCTFDEIYNDNAGPITGGGFCGGVFFFPDDFVPPDEPQTLPSSGQIHDCLFQNIKTLLPDGLSLAEQQNFLDADGIRFYGSSVVKTYLHVSIHDCVFRDCAKRAVKGSLAAGVKVSNINVIATSGLQYPMVTAVKIDGDDFQLRGMNVYSPREAPITLVIQTHDGNNIRVDGVFADRCNRFWSMAPTSTTVVTSGWRVSNLRCNSITAAPGAAVATGVCADRQPDRYEDCIFENVTFECGAGDHALLAGCFVANSSRLEVVLRNWRIVNGDLKLPGYGFTLQDITHEINDAHYAGSTPQRGILEAGQPTTSQTTCESVIDGYVINIKTTPANYLSAMRRYFALIYGDRTRVSRLRMWVPEDCPTTYWHAQFDGSDFTLQDLDYCGPGAIGINAITADGPKTRMTIDGIRRGGGTTATSEFLNLHLADACVVTNVVDYRLSNSPTIRVQPGALRAGHTWAYVIDGVCSCTQNNEVVSDPAGLARQFNIHKLYRLTSTTQCCWPNLPSRCRPPLEPTDSAVASRYALTGLQTCWRQPTKCLSMDRRFPLTRDSGQSHLRGHHSAHRQSTHHRSRAQSPCDSHGG
jgi:hypothetical protein